MAAEFVRRDELATILSQLIGRLDAIQANQTAMRGDMTAFQSHVDQQFATTNQRLDEVINFQHGFKEATEAHTRDLSKQLADVAASLQEQINDLKRQ
jgi:uncharacterized tellurite resistance protein B-like protein